MMAEAGSTSIAAGVDDISSLVDIYFYRPAQVQNFLIFHSNANST